jgi:hypothetical protein
MSHLRANGFRVKPEDVSDVDYFRAKYGIPAAMASCHTAVVDGYAVEGHVPARELKRLLAERPKALGLAVPGMPELAPGMDSRSGAPYDVLLVLPDGRYQVYARYTS